MLSAEHSITLRASAERVWQVVADIDAYEDWHPCFSGVRGTLRANDPLQIQFRTGQPAPETVPTRALVLDVRRHRYLRWLFASPDTPTEIRPSGQSEPGRYEIDIMPGGPGRVRVTQRLTVEPGAGGWFNDDTDLRQVVSAMNTALCDRLAWTSAQHTPPPQTSGTLRISSHCGLRAHDEARRSGTLACVSGLIGRWPWVPAA